VISLRSSAKNSAVFAVKFFLVYTKSEFENEKNEQYSFLNSAIKNSKILYERPK
jgi:hypothetical protein